MKIRNGFVTNSSSSSFIVAFDYEELPNSKEELQLLLFGDKKTRSRYDYKVNCSDIAEIVWKDMHTMEPGWPCYNYEDKPLTAEEQVEQDESMKPWVSYNTIDVWEVARELSYGSIDGSPELYYYRPGEPNTHYSCDPMYNEKYRLPELKVHKREDGTTWTSDQCDYKKYENDCNRWALDKAIELFDKNEDFRFFKFTYADDDGRLGCVMEHGGIFDKLGKDKVIRISKH